LKVLGNQGGSEGSEDGNEEGKKIEFLTPQLMNEPAQSLMGQEPLEVEPNENPAQKSTLQSQTKDKSAQKSSSGAEVDLESLFSNNDLVIYDTSRKLLPISPSLDLASKIKSLTKEELVNIAQNDSTVDTEALRKFMISFVSNPKKMQSLNFDNFGQEIHELGPKIDALIKQSEESLEKVTTQVSLEFFEKLHPNGSEDQKAAFIAKFKEVSDEACQAWEKFPKKLKEGKQLGKLNISQGTPKLVYVLNEEEIKFEDA